MSSGDTIKSGSTAVKKEVPRAILPKPFIPKRAPPMQSVYKEEDYNEDGSLKVLKKIPDGDNLERRRAMADIGTTSRQEYHQAPAMASTPHQQQQQQAPSKQLSHDEQRLAAASNQAEAYSGLPGKADYINMPQQKHRLGATKFDVRTPADMCDPDEQYILVFRTIENRVPDEDRILQHYALQYIARQNGTYNPIEDPPVTLTSLLPTVCIVPDRVFSKDEATSDLKPVQRYVKKLAYSTDLDVIPHYMNKPCTLPIPDTAQVKYKDKIMDQFMTEFYESQQESASAILDRVEADRKGEAPKKTQWQIYDGVSPQGVFGLQSPPPSATADATATKSWGDRCEEEEDDEEETAAVVDDNENEEEWTEVKKKQKPLAAERRGGGRRPAPRKGIVSFD